MMENAAAAKASPYAIELDGCTFCYKGASRPSLRDVSLKIPRGQCVVVTGQSGCGKTTLTRLVNALIPLMYEGDLQGEVLVAGKPVSAWTMGELSAHVGSVFQNPRSQFVNLDVTSEIAFGCENFGIDREEMVERVAQAAATLGIEGLLGGGTEALSGGQKQSVILASAYAVHPDIFVLDEPTASLDVHAMRNLARTVALLKSQGKTVLISEHRLWWLDGIADRYVVISDGSVMGDWAAAEFLALPFETRTDMGLRAASLAEIDSVVAVSPLGDAVASNASRSHFLRKNHRTYERRSCRLPRCACGLKRSRFQSRPGSCRRHRWAQRGWENDARPLHGRPPQGKGGGDRGRRRAASRKETGGARVPGYARTGIPVVQQHSRR